MRLTNLHLHDFRNYPDLSLSPDPGLNILLGKNAQGKTSILESIYFLATARSWRAGKDSELIRWQANYARISAEISREEQNDLEVEVVLSRTEKKQISVNTIRQHKLSDFMGQVNVVLIEPHDVDIVRGDPSTRRKFLNLEISQIQPQYCHLMVGYRRVLEQRNKLLKELQNRGPANGLLGVLNDQLISYGSRILERRISFVQKLAHLTGIIHKQITEGLEDAEVKYVSKVNLQGATQADEIAERLRAAMEELKMAELKRGMTLVGPHRDDLTFLVNGVDAKVYGSQGQQRTVALSLRLAELEVMEESAGEPPIVLLDDVMTDLDEDRRTHVFQMTAGRCQTFVTAASRRAFDPEFLAESTVFDVSQGKVTAE